MPPITLPQLATETKRLLADLRTGALPLRELPAFLAYLLKAKRPRREQDR